MGAEREPQHPAAEVLSTHTPREKANRFLTRELNGILPEIRAPSIVTRTLSPNEHRDHEHQGWKGRSGHTPQQLFF